jgi:hypothetical protein
MSYTKIFEITHSKRKRKEEETNSDNNLFQIKKDSKVHFSYLKNQMTFV